MKEKTSMRTPILQRHIEIRKEDINQENRTVRLSFSSEAPVERFFGKEILDHGKDSVRLDRLLNGGPLLLNHDTGLQIGVVEGAALSKKKGSAEVRFSKSELAEDVFRDVVDGIRRNVSVGYRIHKMILESEEEDEPTYRATDWEPLEVSIVPIPADASVGVGRLLERGWSETIVYTTREVEKMKVPVDETEDNKMPEVKVDISAEREKAILEENRRCSEIAAIGKAHRCEELANKAIKERTPLDDFRAQVLEGLYNAKPIKTPEAGPIGMSERDMQEWSITKAIRSLSELKPLDPVVDEASRAVAKQIRRDPKGFFIPQDIMRQKRVMQAGVAAKGGYTVGTDLMSGEMIELLRNMPLVSQMGARTLSGLTGNVLIPRVTGGATAFWLSESGTATASDQSFGQLALVPRRLVGDTAYTKELVFQSSIDVENFIREDLMTVLAIEKDRAAINGSGASGEPVGIMNTTGILSVTFSAAPTWAKVVDFETQMATNNSMRGSMAYLTTPAVRGKWKTTPKESGQAIYLWGDSGSPGSGLVNGYRAESTNQVPDNKVIFGNWNDLILADWAGVDVVVDPYSLKKTNQIEVTITVYADLALRHAVSMVVSTDSGAQ